MNANTEKIYDEWLVLRCQTGDRDAFARLVSRWQAPLLRFATIVTHNPELAREAVQEAWISVMRAIGKLQDPTRYRPWLFRIVHNKCMDALRARGAVSEAEDMVTARSPLDAVDNREAVDTILAGMSHEHRSVLALHYLYEMEIAEVAELLGIPLGTVKSRLFNAREAFRRAFDGGETDGRPGPEDRASTPRGYRFC